MYCEVKTKISSTLVQSVA